MKKQNPQTPFSQSVLQKINQLKEYMSKSSYTVVFSGAGMSTEAGLPDFRSVGTGMWTQFNPLELASTTAMKHNRDQFIDFYRYRVQSLKECKPHEGHYILAEWEKDGKIQSIITQNVDGFHHAAGNRRILELHGTLRTCHCSECGKTYPIEQFMGENVQCNCGGFIRPSVVLFGEALPEGALHQSSIEAKKADLFIVLGSSLSVSPANLFPLEAKRQGAKLVIINMETTDLDNKADLIINGEKIGDVLRELAK
ncbi:NAD-dependent deacylase [Neobacillus sp. LXY-4]|uniref:NAD-dependent deacylase n=1 Tax=Neobacillus sp. LXY-4 TaxID=3379826 RepID=UPI003EE28421